jgi:hypothetical protein
MQDGVGVAKRLQLWNPNESKSGHASAVEDPSGKLISDKRGVADVFASFYGSLYKAPVAAAAATNQIQFPESTP